MGWGDPPKDAILPVKHGIICHVFVLASFLGGFLVLTKLKVENAFEF